MDLVSIPERVLEALKPILASRAGICVGFNPWKGFRGFEAYYIGVVNWNFKCFNPWKGFRGFEASDLVSFLMVW